MSGVNERILPRFSVWMVFRKDSPKCVSEQRVGKDIFDSTEKSAKLLSRRDQFSSKGRFSFSFSPFVRSVCITYLVAANNGTIGWETTFVTCCCSCTFLLQFGLLTWVSSHYNVFSSVSHPFSSRRLEICFLTVFHTLLCFAFVSVSR